MAVAFGSVEARIKRATRSRASIAAHDATMPPSDKPKKYARGTSKTSSKATASRAIGRVE